MKTVQDILLLICLPFILLLDWLMYKLSLVFFVATMPVRMIYWQWEWRQSSKESIRRVEQMIQEALSR